MSGEGLHRSGGGSSLTVHGSRQSPADKGRAAPTLHGIPSLRWNVGFIGRAAAAARSVGKAIIGAPHSPRLKPSTSDDMELARYPLLNGISPGNR